jgi:hypothetical protein
MNKDNSETGSGKGPALIFGASGEQGRAVVEGMVDAGYHPVYAFARYDHGDYTTNGTAAQKYLTDALGATLLPGDLQNPDHVLNALLSTAAPAIFLVTTTDLPAEIGQTESGFSDAMEAEFQVIVTFFHLLKQAFQKDGISRHVVFSTRDNVQAVVRAHQEQGEGEVWIEALDDGCIVPHYSAKGRGGEYAQQYLSDLSSDLHLTLLTLPFLYANFLGFFCPLADETQTQWTLSACFGNNPIDMMGARDLGSIVRKST